MNRQKKLQKLLTVASEFSAGVLQSEAGQILKWSRQTTSKVARAAVCEGFLDSKRSGRDVILFVNSKGRTKAGESEEKMATCNQDLPFDEINVHDYILKIPVSQAATNSATFRKYWKAKEEGNGKVTYYLKEFIPSVTLKLDGKSIIAYFHSKNFKRDELLDPQITLYTALKLIEIERELVRKFRIYVDIYRTTCINQHIAIRIDSEYLEKLKTSPKVTTLLNRPAQSVLGEMTQEARVYLDKSPPPLCIETTDGPYAHKVQMMPIYSPVILCMVASLHDKMDSLKEQIAKTKDNAPKAQDECTVDGAQTKTDEAAMDASGEVVQTKDSVSTITAP